MLPGLQLKRGISFSVSLVFPVMKPHRDAHTMSADVLNLCQYISTVVLFTILPVFLYSFTSHPIESDECMQESLVTFGPLCTGYGLFLKIFLNFLIVSQNCRLITHG